MQVDDKLKKRIAYEKMLAGISDEVLRAFMNYRWPGNVRELENTIERAFVQIERFSWSIFPPKLEIIPLLKSYCQKKFRRVFARHLAERGLPGDLEAIRVMGYEIEGSKERGWKLKE